MSQIQLEIITPEAAVLDKMVDEVILPGSAGELGILPGHVPLMTTLKSGRLVALCDGETERFAIHGGFAEVLPHKVVILTEAGESSAEIDLDRAREALERADVALKDAEARAADESDAEAVELHKSALARARARILLAEEE